MHFWWSWNKANKSNDIFETVSHTIKPNGILKSKNQRLTPTQPSMKTQEPGRNAINAFSKITDISTISSAPLLASNIGMIQTSESNKSDLAIAAPSSNSSLLSISKTSSVPQLESMNQKYVEMSASSLSASSVKSILSPEEYRKINFIGIYAPIGDCFF